MRFIAVVPARYGSSRLPGKPLLDIGGKPMVQHVYERACLSKASQVVIATDDPRIAQVAEGFGAQVCMTLAEHPSGTDRIEEVSRLLGLADSDIVVNVQGDEPLIPADVINQVAQNLASHTKASMATLSEPIGNSDDLFNPNIVKVVADDSGIALYFSRAAIPWDREAFTDGRPESAYQPTAQRHLGIYAYRVSFLHQFVSWQPHPLELAESLEQLRAMGNGTRIHIAPACSEVPPGVDTAVDLEHVRALVAAGS